MTELEQLARVIFDELHKQDYTSDYRFHGGDTCLDGNFNLDRVAQSILDALPGLGWSRRKDVLEEAAKIADAIAKERRDGAGAAQANSNRAAMLELDSCADDLEDAATAIRSATTRKGEG